MVKNLLASARDMGFNPLVRKILLEKELATHSSVLAWEIPWAEEPCGLQSVRSELRDEAHTHTHRTLQMQTTEYLHLHSKLVDGTVVFNGDQFYPPRGIWQCLEMTLVVTTGGLLLVPSGQRPAQHPTVHGMVPQNNSMEGGKSCSE